MSSGTSDQTTKEVTTSQVSTNQINSNNKVVVSRLKLEPVDQAIKNLSQHPDIKIKDLSEHKDLLKDYDLVKLTSSILYDTSHYQMLIDLISKYPKPSSVIPGTIGAYLFGCFLSSYGDLYNKTCAPVCNGSIQPPRQENHVNHCPYQIWMQQSNDGKSYVLINGSSTRKLAYIYIRLSNNASFDGLTQEEIDTMRQNGVEVAQVYTYNPEAENKYTAITDVVPINDLLVKKKNISASDPPTIIQQLPFCTWLIILMVVIAVLILGIIGVCKYRGYF